MNAITAVCKAAVGWFSGVFELLVRLLAGLLVVQFIVVVG